MAKTSALVYVVVATILVASIQLASGQNVPTTPQQQQPSQQQANDPNCPVARAKAALAQMRANMAQLPLRLNNIRQNTNNPLDQMAKNIASQVSQSASASGNMSQKTLVRTRRAAGVPNNFMVQQQQPMQQQPMQTMQQQPLIPANNGLDAQQQQQLQQQSNRLQTLMQSIQYNVTTEQMQQIVVTLIMIMVTLFTGTAAVGPSAAIMQSILKQVLPVIVNALMQLSGSFTTPAAITNTPTVATTASGW